MFVTKVFRIRNYAKRIAFQRLDSKIICPYNLREFNNNIAYNFNKNQCLNILFNKKLLFNNFCLKQLSTLNQNFQSQETAYARSVLENSEIYSKSLAIHSLSKDNLQIKKAEDLIEHQWLGNTNTEILENFEILSHYALKNEKTLNDKEFKNILTLLKNHCTYLNDKELFQLLHYLELWNKKNFKPFYAGFWKVLDEECLNRMTNWTADEILLVNDYFYKLNLNKISKFTFNSIKRLDPKKMTPANLVQFAFLLRVNKKFFINLEEFENYFEKYIGVLTIEELGIVSMAFFKYEAQINSKTFIIKIIQKLLHNIDTVEEIFLASILKVLRYSIHLNAVQNFDMLLESLTTQIPRLKLQTLTHIAHMQGSILLYNDTLMLKILERFEKDIQAARVKDIERLIFALYILNYDPKTTSLYSIAMKELLDAKRKNEIERYPKSVVYTVMYMLQVNFYPEELLKFVMEPEFVNKFCKNDYSNLEREYLIIENCIEIEHPEYNGPRMKTFLTNFLIKKYEQINANLRNKDNLINQHNKMMIDVIHSCKQALLSESVVCNDILLPHFINADVVLCYDKNTNDFISPSEKLSSISSGTIKYASNDGKKWYALVMGTHNNLTRNTFQPTGVLASRIRHLRRIGYTPILIPYNKWQNLKAKEKPNYINSILENNS